MLIVEMEKILRKAGEILLNADRSDAMVDEKCGHANFVTKYDYKVQNFLKTELLKIEPGSSFVGEENDIGNILEEGLTFIVDPIDGTTNFIRDFKCSAISIGVLKDGKPYIGCVYNPYLNEMYGAQVGLGSYMNGKKLQVSNKSLAEGIVIFGTSLYYKELNKKTFDMAYDYFTRSLDVRRSGSAALDMCYVAAGRAELFFECRLSPWDYAAGYVIVTEAGGKVENMDGGDIVFDKPCGIIAHNGLCN